MSDLPSAEQQAREDVLSRAASQARYLHAQMGEALNAKEQP
ncbi:hypothetical protein SEA_TYKE_10 [Mycobacterium phage Tyke]|uniref:Uncharacterized protein n=1 Tax=Mycobacterium phage DTDevon TaxID=1701800 RepID=A0A0N9EPL4_9CAUD|nr:hypothetical protein SEA_DTDEVON_10 [Mycobacterium phage DTDevon]AVR77748.1 hypothetical protein SEA_TYKE_10 [Mycobacterium phage Tyke]